MKKFLSLLTVFVLAFALAVPAGATSTVVYGEWLFNEKAIPVANLMTSVQESINFTSNGETFTSIWYCNSNNCIYYHDGIDYRIVYTYDGGWKQEGYRSVDFGEAEVTVTSEFYTILTDNAVSLDMSCDGSSCPATDVNFDDVCDDCGMMLAYNLRVTPDSYEIVVEHSDSLTLLYRYTETLAGTAFDAVYDDNRITVTFDNPVNHTQLKLEGDEWVDHASYPNTYDSHTISLSSDASIRSSDMDIYDANGDLFFQNPLWMTVEKVTQGEMGALTQETAGTMRVLVVCGVGLMACLMALILFGKRWLIFLR